MTPESIEQQLRFHLQRKLRLIRGNGQITVRRLVKCLWSKQGGGTRYAMLRNQSTRAGISSMLLQLGYVRKRAARWT